MWDYIYIYIYAGFSQIREACCKVGHNGTGRCIPDEYARNKNRSVFWDGFHLAPAANSVIATKCFNGSGVCTANIYMTPFSVQPDRRPSLGFTPKSFQHCAWNEE
ncbi:hypothetical protein FEM48_Zijuj08G0134500 [Ziziphus jujuba var. spinosa]|uniref:GDSL esterase/lipase n=1 Tax=Ziziphus jujuba var. spinosa TaxID=714518 RepID=A0A978UZD2_ZIZJJ|nr:hypothetical protein FEM48_Zijuj08G0134500 [Ziziphus jujuba var. spinosa]